MKDMLHILIVKLEESKLEIRERMKESKQEIRELRKEERSEMANNYNKSAEINENKKIDIQENDLKIKIKKETIQKTDGHFNI